jgi:hypothetical protein
MMAYLKFTNSHIQEASNDQSRQPLKTFIPYYFQTTTSFRHTDSF